MLKPKPNFRDGNHDLIQKKPHPGRFRAIYRLVLRLSCISLSAPVLIPKAGINLAKHDGAYWLIDESPSCSIYDRLPALPFNLGSRDCHFFSSVHKIRCDGVHT